MVQYVEICTKDSVNIAQKLTACPYSKKRASHMKRKVDVQKAHNLGPRLEVFHFCE